MNLLLLTQEEAALAGRPVNQPRMDTEGGELAGEKVGRWEEEKRSKCPRTLVQDRTQSGLDGGGSATGHSSHPGGEEEFLRLLFEFTHSVQSNPDRTIALAAKRWERTLRFRLAVMRQRRWGGREGGKWAGGKRRKGEKGWEWERGEMTKGQSSGGGCSMPSSTMRRTSRRPSRTRSMETVPCPAS